MLLAADGAAVPCLRDKALLLYLPLTDVVNVQSNVWCPSRRQKQRYSCCWSPQRDGEEGAGRLWTEGTASAV
jgi:hypothetical protein